ncbi:Inosine-guanosine kinase [Symbiodinium microadriaticum]|uniref:Inosine-guanosine kinase n=1 Tax=Symbiodinium microadriaticum TaxID=2951 RepID=A0A1Q9EMP3_SYMMI|nr:Inosine-guanosine kinase [Symbiodinium microadriaticum]
MAGGPVVVAVGSPNWDTMAFVPDTFLSEHGLGRGDATPLDDGAAFRALKESAKGLSARTLSQCGGCACNTAKVLSCLGCQTFFCGCVGGDVVASEFREALCQLGMVDLCAEAFDRDSGEVLCLVTDDGERSFAYRTGVASDALEAAALSAALDRVAGQSGKVDLVYFDAYSLLCPGSTAEEGLRKARSLGAKTGMNLGSSGIVRAQQKRLWQLLRDGELDVIMLNQDEAAALFGEDMSPSDICGALSEHCELAVLTLGSTGLWVAQERGPPEFQRVEPLAEVVDSTGAGDFFAGGFLAAWLRREPSNCTPWGYASATAVLQVFGTDLGPEGWHRLRKSCAEATAKSFPRLFSPYTALDGQSFLEIEFEFKDGTLRASKTVGQLPEAVAAAVSAEIERVEIFGLKSPLTAAEATLDGKVSALPKPISRALSGDGSASLHAAMLKVKPRIDMRQAWSISVK